MKPSEDLKAYHMTYFLQFYLIIIRGSRCMVMNSSLDYAFKFQVQYKIWSLFVTGKIFLQWYGTEPQLVIFEPELCKEILNNKEGVFLQVQQKGFAMKILGNGLGTAEGEHWAKLRKVANHAFHGESLKVSCYNYSSQFLQIEKIMS